MLHLSVSLTSSFSLKVFIFLLLLRFCKEHFSCTVVGLGKQRKYYFDDLTKDSMAIRFIYKEKLTWKKHSAHVILQACCTGRVKLSNIVCFWL